MTMKLPRKLLSCLLVLAICITTVFGCLITASAGTAPSYTIADGAVKADLTEATVDVTFNVPSGMSAGFFTVENYNNSYASVTAEVTGGTPVSGSYSADDFSFEDENGEVKTAAVSTTDMQGSDLARISFEVNDTEKLYTSVTLTLTFTFAGGAATKGNNYTVAINDLDFSGRYAAVTDKWTGAAGTIETGCDHIVTVSEDDLIKTDSVNGYSVYKDSSCSVCGDPDNELGYQVVPTKTPGKVVYWSGEVADGIADDTSATDATKGTKENPIIINSAEELAYIATVQTDAANATTGKYYKVADDIEAIVLQPKSAAAKAIMSLTTANQVKNYFENGNIAEPKPWVSNGWKTASAVYPFAGNFDGNGVTIYGMYFSKPTNDGTYTGLFSYVAGDPKVENVTIANAYLVSAAHMGAVSSYLQTGNVNGTYNKIALENCAVINSYMESRANQHCKTAALLTGSMKVRELKNCIVYGNNAYNAVVYNAVTNKTGYDLTLVADMTNDKNTQDNFTNVISLGAIPYSAYNYGYYALCSTTTPFTNVYTDVSIEKTLYKISDTNTDNVRLEVASSKISDTVINSLTATTAAQVKTQSFVDTLNANDGNADADVWQLDAKTGYPTFAKDVAEPGSTDIVEVWGDGKSTLTGEAAEHVISGTAEPTWYDNTFELLDPTNEENSEANPYIIDSAEGLAWLATQATAAETTGKWYKIADGIKAFNMNTKVDMSGDMTLAEVEAALNTICQMKTWWGGKFAGSFDGNGVTIYGVQGYNTTYNKGSGSLFGTAAAAGTTFKNFTLKNSYFKGDSAGSLFNNATGTGTITVENVVLTGNVMVSYRNNGAESYGGVLFGRAGNNKVDVKNCLVYNNIAKHQGFYTVSGYEKTGYDVTYGFMGNASKVDNVNPSVENTIILDCLPFTAQYSYSSSSQIVFSNVYTNMLDVEVTNTMINGDTAETVYTTRYTSGVISQGDGKYKLVVKLENKDNSGKTSDLSQTVGAGSFYPIAANDIKGLAAGSVVTELNTANDATVWATTANGYPTPMAAYADTINSVSSVDLMLKAANLTYNNNGSFNFNFHYEPAYTGFAPDLYVAQADLSGFTKLEAQESSYAGNGLSADAVMYTIENISAREIGDTMLPTIVAANGDQAIWGKTEAISVKDYAIDVINGEAVYTEDATEEEIQQDKNVAAALINYGEAAKNALTQDYDGNAGGTTIYWDGKTYTKPTDTDAAGNILINKAAELAYIALKATVDETTGNNYKIADGISNIILQPESSVDGDMLMGLTDNTQVKDYLTGKTEWQHKSGIFNGNFDGNGVTIYGLYQEDHYCGLFPYVDGGKPNDEGKDTTGITIKNINLKNSYMVTAWRMGAIFGYSQPNTAGKLVNGTINIEGCVVANCYMTNSDKNASNKGMFTGANNSEELHVRNCLVYNNYYTVQLKDSDGNVTGTQKLNFLGGAINLQANRDAGLYSTIENSILLDISPNDGTQSYNLSTVNTFANVYTNVDYQVTTDTTDKNFYYKATDIDSVTTEGAQGSAASANMPNLDWSKWAYGYAGEYPTPITSATTETAGRIEYWDGTRDTTLADSPEETGESWEKAIIIDSAEELAQLVRTNAADSINKHYKVANDIAAFVLQSDTVIDDIQEFASLSSADAVKKYFDDKIEAGVTPKDWHDNYFWSGIFDGSFDGNGVEIYGLYSNSDNAALFMLIDGGGTAIDSENPATIYEGGITLKNFAVKNAYLTTTNRGGVIVGQAYGSKVGMTTSANVNGIINIDSCTVANCYMRLEKAAYKCSSAGLVTGDIGTDTININNCLVYGNYAYGNDDKAIALRAMGANRFYEDGKTRMLNKITNTIALGIAPYNLNNHNGSHQSDPASFENVYTDQPTGTVALNNTWGTTSNFTYTKEQIAHVELSDMIGSNAADVVKAINDANGDSRDMYVGNAWGYPGFEKAGTMPTTNQMAFDGLTMTNYDTYTTVDPMFSMYATSLNLKANPYIAFTFAFGKDATNDYKTNRDNITVTFTTASGKTVTTTVGNGKGGVSAGWTNNAAAGRYHLYRFDSVPVEDLCKPITVTVKYGDNEAVSFGTFSVEGFALDIANAYKQDPCDYYATRVEAAKALLYYTQMINARYGSVA